MTESPVKHTAEPRLGLRKDRLVALIGVMGDGELHRAEDLAMQFRVSQRTLYRDMDTLIASGIPVAAKRGAGYQLTADVTLPPLNLSMAELETLHLGLAVLNDADDAALRAASRSLAAKIDAVLPENRIASTTGWGLAVYPFADAASGIRHIPALRTAIRKFHKVNLTYRAEDQSISTTLMHPVELDFWGRVWTCMVWNERDAEFQTLRVDRITGLVDTEIHYTPRRPG